MSCTPSASLVGLQENRENTLKCHFVLATTGLGVDSLAEPNSIRINYFTYIVQCIIPS